MVLQIQKNDLILPFVYLNKHAVEIKVMAFQKHHIKELGSSVNLKNFIKLTKEKWAIKTAIAELQQAEHVS